MYIVTTEEMRRIESASDANGHTYDDMMRLAGAAVAEAVADEIEHGVVVVLCGPGNNGGDGLVAAGILAGSGYDVRVAAWHRAPGDALPEVAGQLADSPMLTIEGDESLAALREWLAEADVVVDGLLGTGIARPIEGGLAAILGALGAARSGPKPPIVVAVDVPTGLDSDTGTLDTHTVPADVTVTFGYPKRGQLLFPGAAAIGELIVDRIGLPGDAFEGPLRLAASDEIAALLPARPGDGHKGTFGRVLVVAGSVNYTGAAYLAAAAAYRSGCGLVTAAVPASIHGIVAALVPEATFLVLPEDLGVLRKEAALIVREAWPECDVVLLGPGLTTQQPAREFVTALLAGARSTQPPRIGFGRSPSSNPVPAAADSEWPGDLTTRMVIDADGLNLLADIEGGLSWLPSHAVLTPHPGEMARLTGTPVADVQSDRLGAARRASAEWGHVVVLKGALTVVSAPDGRQVVNPFANSGLATGGTGDVLSGLLAGFLAQGLEPFGAAVVACFVHGLAGELAAEGVGERAMTAGDVLAYVAPALQRLEAEET